ESVSAPSRRVVSTVGRSSHDAPSPSRSTSHSPAPPSPCAATTTWSATARSGTNSAVPDSRSPSARTAKPSASNRPSAPAHASVAADFPATTDSSSSGASDSAGSASTTVEKNGPGYTARPSSSITTISSRKLIPAPPASSGSEIPVQPSSATSDHDDGSKPSPSA